MQNDSLKKIDPKIYNLIEKEKIRISNGLELIPSENFASKAVLEALGSVLTNKYSEGYPKKRYYAGNEVIDEIELLAQSRAKSLFKAEHVNVQPYSGSPANFEVYSALAGKDGKIMGMNLSMGGHLTHGHSASLTGKFFISEQYGVDKKTHLLDYDAIREQAKKSKPNILISGASAYPRKIDFKQFNEIAREVGAISMADISHISGLIIGKEHPSPFPFTDVVTTTTHKTLRGPRGAIIMCKEEFAKKIDSTVFPGLQGGPHNNVIGAMAVAFEEASTDEYNKYTKQIVKNAKVLSEVLINQKLNLITGGTDNHLMLVDMTSLDMSGAQAEQILENVGIIVNKNTIPYDLRKPFDPSGIRLGTPAMTTLGMKETEMEQIGLCISKVLKNKDNKQIAENVKKEVNALCKQFKFY